MASKFLGLLGALALVGTCMGAISTFSHVSPHTHLYHGAAIPTPLDTITYTSHTPVYHPYHHHVEQQQLEHHQLQHHQLEQHHELEHHQLEHHQLEHHQQHQHLDNHYHYQQPLVYHKTIATPFTSYYTAPQHLVKRVVRPASSPVVTLARTVLGVPQVLRKPHTVAIAEPATVAVSVAASPAARAAHAAPTNAQVVDFDASPNYDFSYGVQDFITGDIKSQVESRSGGSVQGAYSVLDADGYKRTVTYTADDLNGFNAVVSREPVDEKVVVAAPVATTSTAPVLLAHASVVATPVHHVPLQQHFQYEPQLPVQHVSVEQQQQPEKEEQQQPEQPAEDQQQQQQHQYPQDQQFPPQFPQFEQPENNQDQEEKQEEGGEPQKQSQDSDGEVSSPIFDDSDVVEARSGLKNKNNQKSQQQQ